MSAVADKRTTMPIPAPIEATPTEAAPLWARPRTYPPQFEENLIDIFDGIPRTTRTAILAEIFDSLPSKGSTLNADFFNYFNTLLRAAPEPATEPGREAQPAEPPEPAPRPMTEHELLEEAFGGPPPEPRSLHEELVEIFDYDPTPEEVDAAWRAVRRTPPQSADIETAQPTPEPDDEKAEVTISNLTPEPLPAAAVSNADARPTPEPLPTADIKTAPEPPLYQSHFRPPHW